MDGSPHGDVSSRGIKHGRPLSPLLFALATEPPEKAESVSDSVRGIQEGTQTMIHQNMC